MQDGLCRHGGIDCAFGYAAPRPSGAADFGNFARLKLKQFHNLLGRIRVKHLVCGLFRRYSKELLCLLNIANEPELPFKTVCSLQPYLDIEYIVFL